MQIWKMMIQIMTSYPKPVAKLVNRSLETERTKMMLELVGIDRCQQNKRKLNFGTASKVSPTRKVVDEFPATEKTVLVCLVHFSQWRTRVGSGVWRTPVSWGQVAAPATWQQQTVISKV